MNSDKLYRIKELKSARYMGTAQAKALVDAQDRVEQVPLERAAEINRNLPASAGYKATPFRVYAISSQIEVSDMDIAIMLYSDDEKERSAAEERTLRSKNPDYSDPLKRLRDTKAIVPWLVFKYASQSHPDHSPVEQSIIEENYMTVLKQIFKDINKHPKPNDEIAFRTAHTLTGAELREDVESLVKETFSDYSGFKECWMVEMSGLDDNFAVSMMERLIADNLHKDPVYRHKVAELISSEQPGDSSSFIKSVYEIQAEDVRHDGEPESPSQEARDFVRSMAGRLGQKGIYEVGEGAFKECNNDRLRALEEILDIVNSKIGFFERREVTFKQRD